MLTMLILYAKYIFCLCILQIFIALYKSPSRDSFWERRKFLRTALDRVRILALHHTYGLLKKRIWKENGFLHASHMHKWSRSGIFFLKLFLSLLQRGDLEWILHTDFSVGFFKKITIPPLQDISLHGMTTKNMSGKAPAL